jgi:nitrite reductase/ring-hydroxylating ferredoxin subunit/uncharacterized membrane protein
MGLNEWTRQLEGLQGLDGIAEKIASSVGKVVPHGPVKDAMSGTWLGHALHPALTDVPIGVWMSATLLDLLGGEEAEPAADLLVKIGLLATVPTVVAGLSDWSDTMGGERRIGLVHAGGNSVAAALYACSSWARSRGRRRFGIALGLAGSGATFFSAYLGGHLSLALGIGVDQTALEAGPSDWTRVMSADELVQARPTRVEIDGTAILLVRRGERIDALSDRCSHLSGPLSEGKLDGDRIVCPWHGSTFRLTDGGVVRGPARAPQPAYDARVESGGIEVRLRPRGA